MKLPLTNNPEEDFQVSIFNFVYNFRQLWNAKGFWTLDIKDNNKKVLVLGVKIVAGINLLQQFPGVPFDLKNSTEIDPTRDSLDSFNLEIIDKNV